MKKYIIFLIVQSLFNVAYSQETTHCVKYLDLREALKLKKDSCLIDLHYYSGFDKSIPIEILQLSNIHKLTISVYSDYFDWSKSIEIISKIPTLKSLSIYNHNKNKTLISELSLLKNISTLYISSPADSILSTSIGELKYLINLTIDCSLDELPISFQNLEKLNYLDISNNDFTQFPEVIIKLKTIQHLDLRDNLISSLPDSIYIPTLKFLSIHIHDSINIKPLTNLTNLDSLEVYQYYTNEIPDEISKLKNIEYLEFSGRTLLKTKSSFKSLSKLNNLTELNLSFRNLEIPIESYLLCNLKCLIISAYNDDYNPVAIRNLERISTIPNLEKLEYWHYNDSILPPNIYHLKQLKKLSLISTRILSLPKEINGLDNLEFIKISRDVNFHKSFDFFIPNEIKELKNLKYCTFNQLPIKQLPNSITELDSLEYLEVSLCDLENLPDSIGNLKNLKELNLFSNPIDTLPTSFGLLNLQKIKMSNCNFKEIDNEILKLDKLVYLDLSHQPINIIPDSIFLLQKLEYLDLEETLVNIIPNSLKLMPNLKQLILCDNEFENNKLIDEVILNKIEWSNDCHYHWMAYILNENDYEYYFLDTLTRKKNRKKNKSLLMIYKKKNE